jgi:hypothetical protein
MNDILFPRNRRTPPSFLTVPLPSQASPTPASNPSLPTAISHKWHQRHHSSASSVRRPVHSIGCSIPQDWLVLILNRACELQIDLRIP